MHGEYEAWVRLSYDAVLYATSGHNFDLIDREQRLLRVMNEVFF